MSLNRYYPRPDILDRIPKDKHTVIEASAGTGKTYTIEHLFIDLLLQPKKVTIDSILVLTFTERAAGELRSRVRSMIEKVIESQPSAQKPEGKCWTIGPEEKVHLERSLFSFDMAPIHTIHSFFQRVVNEHAFSSGRLFEQSLVDGKSVFHEAFLEALRTEFSCNPHYSSYLNAWFASGKTIDNLSNKLNACYEKKRRILPEFRQNELSVAVAKLAAALQGSANIREQFLAEAKKNKINGNSSSAIARRIDKWAALFSGCNSTSHLPGFLMAISESDIKYVLDRIAPCTWSDPIHRYIDALQEVQQHFVSLDVAVVALFLPVVKKRLEQKKRAEGLYDYDDMISHLLDALRGPQRASLINALRSRYRYALIDESQDTDSRQWEIFNILFVQSGGENILYLVGDPKQAIYGFRGADVFTYLKAKETLCKQHPPVPLTSNFRSTAGLIEAFNEIFSDAASAPFFQGKIQYDTPLLCGKPDYFARDCAGQDVTPVVVWEIGEGADDPVFAPDFQIALGNAIAAEIQNLLNGGLADLKASEIFILTRTMAEGRRIATFLRKAGLPFAFYKLDGLFQTPQAKHILDLLRAIDRPFDESNRLRAWLTPFFGISLDQLLVCKGLPESNPLVKRLLDWHALAIRRNFAALVSSIINESGLVRRTIFFEDSERELTDYLHILELVMEEASGGGKELSDIIQLLSDYIKETRNPAREDGSVQRLETDKEAVQIMTMHKSKGLEASVVFVYGGYSAGHPDDFHLFHADNGEAVLHIDKDSDYAERAKEESDDENRRLLYVAATRAKAKLYLPFVPSHKNQKPGMYRLLNDRIESLLADEENAGRKGIVKRPLPYMGGTASAGDADVATVMRSWRPAPSLLQDVDETDRFDGLREGHAGFDVTSYSRMKMMRAGYTTAGGDEERIFDDRGTEGGKLFTQSGLPSGPRFGKALHAVMEQVSFQHALSGGNAEQWVTPEVRSLARQSLTREGLSPEHSDYLLLLTYNALMSSVRFADGSVLAKLAEADQVAREVEFLYPYPEKYLPGIATAQWPEIHIGRGYVKGFMDMVFTYGGRVHLCDWKTDILPDYSSTCLQTHFHEHYDL